ncbi:unnamed protein product [Sphagnum jensenii]|uniref:ENTH domain-containing protein n=1 Tax=Sphagnum jensenii TaxID=128206 RepID=A0ABP0WAX3_9BRYO
MAPRQLRKAIGAMKDQTSIAIANVASTRAPDLEVAIVKATSHEEAPVDDKYVQEILHLTSHSRFYVSACAAGVARRLGKTHNWIVALKCLTLAHRLICEGDPSFELELKNAGSRRGMRMLNLSHFKDDTHSNSWDYSSFVRTYALFLDEKLDFDGGGSYRDRRSRGDDDDDDDDDDSSPGEKEPSLAEKEASILHLLEKLPALQKLMDRILGCRPTGAAKMNRVVQIALYPLVKESFHLYSSITEGTTILLDGFFDLEQPNRIAAFEIYNRSAKQGDELRSFYVMCKEFGIGRSSEYPSVDKISQEHLDTLEDFLRNRTRSEKQKTRSKSPEPKPLQLEYKPESPEQEPAVVKQATDKPVEEAAPRIEVPVREPVPVQQQEGDLLNLDEPISAAEHEDKLALALFSDGPTGKTTWEPFGSKDPAAQESNGSWETSGNGKVGWELALVSSTTSNQSKPRNGTLAGGFDPLLLSSMYQQGEVRQQQAAATAIAAQGSASSVALPVNRSPGSSLLALPAPPGAMPLTVGGEDPFAASAMVPPPAYVQMADLTKKQQLLAQEQALWQQYQMNGMQGQLSLMNNPYASGMMHQTMAPPFYSGVGMSVQNYSYHV